MRTLAVAAALAGAVFGACFGVLEGGLAQPSGAERIALRELRVLHEARSAGALVHLGGRTLVVRCRRFSTGTFAVGFGGRELRVSGAHVRGATSPLDVAAGVLAGVHALYERLLTVRLTNRDVALRALSFAGRPAYALRLTGGRPEAELIVERGALRPLGVLYRSRTISGRSRLLPGGGC